MADTVETLRAELDKLRAEFNAFKEYATPVIDAHQPGEFVPNTSPVGMPPFPLPSR